jgi:diguanylate cyclase (GGDEF)-like protein
VVGLVVVRLIVVRLIVVGFELVGIELVGIELVGFELVGFELVGFELVGIELVGLELVCVGVAGRGVARRVVGLTEGLTLLASRTKLLLPTQPSDAAPQEARSVDRRLRPSTPRTPTAVWLMIATMTVAAALLMTQLPGLAAPETATWLCLAGAVVAFGVAEAFVIHVELGRNAHSVSLSEVVLVICMFFVPVPAIPFARVLGGLAVLLAVRHQRLPKALFNASLWLLTSTTAAVAFTQLGGGLHRGSAGMVLPAIAAATTAAGLDSLGVTLVIAATSHSLPGRSSARFVGVCVTVALCASMLGQVLVAALAWSMWLLPATLVVVVAAVAVFRHLSRVRTRHEDVATLYGFTDALSRTGHQTIIETVLSQITQLLRAERAGMWLALDDDRMKWTSLEEDGALVCTTVEADQVPEAIRRALSQDNAVVLHARDRDPATQEFLGLRHARDAVIAPLRSGGGVLGVMTALDRQGEVSTFTASDGHLLLSLTGHAASAMANAQLVAQLNHDSTHDSLTGLLNRGGFRFLLERSLSEPLPLSVLLMDLDRFKEINDTLGHHYGDLLLQQIARRLEHSLRSADVLARLGGDEFAVLLKGVSHDEVFETAERLRDALAEPLQLQGVDIEVSASIGIELVDGADLDASGPGARAPRQSAEAVMQHADVAMYAAKRDGAGVQIYQDTLRESSVRRLALAGALRGAIDERQFFLHYQPQVSLRDGTIAGAEALLRWTHPLYGTVPPDEFIALAEQGGLIRELTRYVLDVALADCAVWAAAGHPMSVSVNLSVRNLLEPDLVDVVETLLSRHGVPAARVVLEITETQLMADPERTGQTLHDLADLGLRLSIDDFGTGYSSLAYLRRLPVSEIKIDKTFVGDLSRDGTDTAIVEAITQLGHTLGLSVVAEGVEDTGTHARLASLGCDYVQGYHLAMPMSHVQLLTWMSAQPDPRMLELPQPRLAATPKSAQSS